LPEGTYVGRVAICVGDLLNIVFIEKEKVKVTLEARKREKIVPLMRGKDIMKTGL
jgi:hypothetical protein